MSGINIIGGATSTNISNTNTFNINVPAGTLAFGPIESITGYLLCDGSLISRTTYANLFAEIGTNFDSGDGSTTFGLPDYRGRFPGGYDADRFATLFSLNDDGLPNITGGWNNVGVEPSFGWGSGAFFNNITDGTFYYHATGRGTDLGGFYFDASRSNAIYGNSNYVMPKSFAVNWFIKY